LLHEQCSSPLGKQKVWPIAGHLDARLRITTRSAAAADRIRRNVRTKDRRNQAELFM
jgi:hypothetical protein